MKARYDLILSLDFIDTYERSCHLICVVAFKILLFFRCLILDYIFSGHGSKTFLYFSEQTFKSMVTMSDCGDFHSSVKG